MSLFEMIGLIPIYIQPREINFLFYLSIQNQVSFSSPERNQIQ